jgi:hypothetical protein
MESRLLIEWEVNDQDGQSGDWGCVDFTHSLVKIVPERFVAQETT